MKIGDKVRTKKGCRLRGPFSGKVIKVGKQWGKYPAVIVEKWSGKKVMCLEKNLIPARPQPSEEMKS